MRLHLASLLFLFFGFCSFAQSPTRYEIRFENAVHHEAEVSIRFSDLDKSDLRIRMSRSSPGRYAVHEFAKNVYRFSARDGKGKALIVHRPNPHEWVVSGHDGTVEVSYTLFANRGDGTYSQIDESHAHLNIPATFAYAPDYEDRPIEIRIHPREDLSWKVSTQLKAQGDNLFFAPNTYYFMDSPIEVSDHEVKSFELKSGDRTASIRFALHQENGYEGFEQYMRKVEAVVREQMQTFGELPDFDYGTYTFLACYAPNVDGDGMEHRNSTVITSTRSLAEGGQERNIGTVAHEFFHAWNVERIRPKSLEPFDFEDANLSGELWFAEGFASYYTSLTLRRADLMSTENYAGALGRLLSYVVNSPGRELFNPVEMSYQAPFVDAATSVDQVNRENTYTDYYSYGNVLGLVLDLSLRRRDDGKNLDDFMRLVWERRGKKELPYTLQDLQELLSEYSDEEFAASYFRDYVFDSKLPDFSTLLAHFGIRFERAQPNNAHLGANITVEEGRWLIASNPTRGSALYQAGMSKGDLIRSMDGRPTDGKISVSDFMSTLKPGQKVNVSYLRHGKAGEQELTLGSDPSFQTELMEEMDRETRKRMENWLIRDLNSQK